MKKTITIFFMAMMLMPAIAQQYINIYKNSVINTYQLYEDDSLYFNDARSMLYFSNNGLINEFVVDNVDSITVGVNTDNNIYIDFQEDGVEITNPLLSSGVSITSTGNHVTINSVYEVKDINYICSGTASDGSITMYSPKRFNLLLNNLDLTNPSGAAINIQSDKKATIHAVSGTSNVLTDGATYVIADAEMDMKAALFSESKLKFIGTGTLTVNGLGDDKHAIASDDEVLLESGNIIVTSASKDGVHAKDGFYMQGGALNITASADGIDGDEGIVEILNGSITVNDLSDDQSAIKCDSTFTVSGGTIVLDVAGDQSKGFKSKQGMFLLGGSISGTASGDVVLEASGSGYDASYCTLIKADSSIVIDGASIDIVTTGTAARGLSCDVDINMESGELTVVSSGDGDAYTNADGEADAYHGACIKVDGDLNIYGGTVALSNSGSGGKGISSDNDIVIGDGVTEPVVSVTTSGSKITVSSTASFGGPGGGPGGFGGEDDDYDESKAIKADVAFVMNSGELNVNSADDGIKALESITFENGVVNITNAIEGVEAPNITCNDGEVNINCSDDGFNATYGTGSESSDGSLLSINGGQIYISASGGDALDSNGEIEVNGGTTIVHGPPSSPEVGLDVNGSALVSNGFIVISGINSNMSEGFSTSSNQYSLILKSSSTLSANSIIHIQDALGNDICSFAPERNYSHIVFSSPELSSGSTYYIYTGGSYSGTNTNGLYTDGTYSAGTQKTSFTISSKVTTVSF